MATTPPRQLAAPPTTQAATAHTVGAQTPADDAAVAIEARYQALGGPTGVLGPPTSVVTPITGGFMRTYEKGRIYYSLASGAFDVRQGPMLDYYLFLGAENAKMGYPTSSQYAGPVPNSLVQNFTGGRIYYGPATGARGVYGPLLARYLALGGPTGVLGMPTVGEGSAQPAGARVSVFEHGRIYWSSATGAWEITGAFVNYYLRTGGSAGTLGLPTGATYTSGRSATVQNYVKGRVYYTPATGPQGVYGATLTRYLALGGSGGTLGLPTKGEYAGAKAGVRVTWFQRGRVYYSAATGAREVQGAIMTRYVALGGEASWIGLPNSYRKATSYGLSQSFQVASIQYYNAQKRAFVRLTFRTTVTTPTAANVRYTYRSGCPVKPSGLRMIKVPFRNFSNEDVFGLIVVKASVVADVTATFKAAHSAGWQIHRVNPVDAYKGSDIASMRVDNTSAFNCRKVTGNPYRLSQHSYGNAIDINTFENPYVTATKVYPEGSATYLDRSNYRRGMIRRGDPVESTMRRLGWPWGARWRYPDYQHFSENGA